MCSNHRSTLKIIIFLVMASLWYTLSFAGDDDDKEDNFSILVTGNFHRSDINQTIGEQWVGLFKTDSGYVLESVEIITKPWHDVCIDGPGDTTGISVSVNHPMKPLVLIQSRPKLKSGLVSTPPAEYDQIEPGKLFFFGQHVLTALGQVTDEGFRHPGDLLILGYQLMLFEYPYSKDKRQTLVEYQRTAYDGLPGVLWAGDLDRDGQLDLLLDIRNHYATRHYALFLSTEADSSRLVKLVADLFKTGC